MDATIATQMTPQGLLIPRAALEEWTQTELEAIKVEVGILIRPKAPLLEQECALDMQILEEAGLLLPTEPPSQLLHWQSAVSQSPHPAQSAPSRQSARSELTPADSTFPRPP